MEPIIKVEKLSKSYILKHQGSERYSTLRDVISKKTKGLLSKKTKEVTATSEKFWALKEVSFEIGKGERIGIIGRNGAGKSTLLKILSRIVEPTQGRITIEGRVASLLEVGTGFHPELTGRENIFLNGSILGMRKEEIKSKFDDIVAFAEVEKFLDTPVKRYSSGMYVRLAFAVAAHLEPEILIVDEVLAVGDAEFQKKCLGKMKDVSGSGRTVLFVSHNMAAIQNLCTKVIYLENGKVKQAGPAEEVIAAYLHGSSEISSINLEERKDRTGNGKIKFLSAELVNENGQSLKAFQCGKPGILRLNFNQNSSVPLSNFHVSVGIDDEQGQRVTYFSNEITNQVFSKIPDDKRKVEIVIPKIPLKSGKYTFTLYSTINGELADYILEAGNFDVEAGDFFNTGKLPPAGQGSFYVEHQMFLK